MSSVKSPAQLLVLGAIALAVVGLSMFQVLPKASYRTLTIAITLIGIIMCSVGSVGYFVTRSLLHPLTLLSMALGVFALTVGTFTMLNRSIPYITSDRVAFYTVALIIVAKFVVARIHTVLN